MVGQLRTRVKICGLTREDDVCAAVNAGADAIGFVFYPHSKRFVTVEQAAHMRRQVPAFVDVVALFVNADPVDIQAVITHVQPDILQFHGDESPEECMRYGHRYMRAFRVGGPQLESPAHLLNAAMAYSDASAWLFDSHSEGYGGSGQSFNRTLLSAVLAAPQARPLVLAGGLDADTVTDAIRQLRPFAVDVSSGVEVSPGVKSEQRVRDFIQAVHDADSHYAHVDA